MSHMRGISRSELPNNRNSNRSGPGNHRGGEGRRGESRNSSESNNSNTNKNKSEDRRTRARSVFDSIRDFFGGGDDDQLANNTDKNQPSDADKAKEERDLHKARTHDPSMPSNKRMASNQAKNVGGLLGMAKRAGFNENSFLGGAANQIDKVAESLGLGDGYDTKVEVGEALRGAAKENNNGVTPQDNYEKAGAAVNAVSSIASLKNPLAALSKPIARSVFSVTNSDDVESLAAFESGLNSGLSDDTKKATGVLSSAANLAGRSDVANIINRGTKIADAAVSASSLVGGNSKTKNTNTPNAVSMNTGMRSERRARAANTFQPATTNNTDYSPYYTASSGAVAPTDDLLYDYDSHLDNFKTS
ncbi:hypothetical protein KCM76_22940 [Zooshikella marina]|uniref:hypothetical protein n=1 Tax=Zooshikella ganghwensis TaxID=202772 RepID=UPI001BB075CE|nr:hypothetical protein [Zooshikella ganghwensis]MBU2708869.1 hypothetical protein [Zooshikella ganghwensis]